MKLSVIVITEPEFVRGEAEIITTLLESGAADRVHLRKPEAREPDMKRLIDRIPQTLHRQLSLHDCHSLAPQYGCGIHLNARNPEAPSGFCGPVSRSCHSPEEAGLYPEADYIFLSPIYPSISKPGYHPKFSPDGLRGKVDRRTVALGGVTPERFAELADVGFGGAAMLGCVWDEVRNGNTSELIRKIICSNT